MWSGTSHGPVTEPRPGSGRRPIAKADSVATDSPPPAPRYREFFVLFNRADYFDAHEVLEGLWHEVRPDGEDADFFKGLIQVAGAFTHLKIHFENPAHPVHARRLRPAARLFRSAAAYLAPCAPDHHGLDVDEAVALCRNHSEAIESSRFKRNPWSPRNSPKLELSR